MPMYMEGEVPTVVNAGAGYNNGFGGGFSDGWWGIILIALLFGWGRNGNGLGSGNGSGSEFVGYQLGKMATTNDVASGFSTSEIMGDLNSIILGQANMQNYINQGFAGVNATVNSVGNTINQGICNLGYNIQGNFNSLSHPISDCCCTTQRLIERQTCDLVNNANSNTQKILDFLCTEKINALTAENATLKGRISNDAQTAAIVGALSPKQPVPAYPVFPATSFAHPSGVTFGFGGSSNCCGCASTI